MILKRMKWSSCHRHQEDLKDVFASIRFGKKDPNWIFVIEADSLIGLMIKFRLFREPIFPIHNLLCN